MGIETAHFSLPYYYGGVTLSSPKTPPQPGTCYLAVVGDKLKLSQNNVPLPPGAVTELEKVVSFIRSHVDELEEGTFKQQDLFRPINALIKRHNQRVWDSNGYGPAGAAAEFVARMLTFGQLSANPSGSMIAPLRAGDGEDLEAICGAWFDLMRLPVHYSWTRDE